MSGRPRKGRSVAFATITPARAQPDPVLGLKFTIEARHGGTVLVDMTVLDPRPLAIAFAGALRRLAALGGSIGAASFERPIPVTRAGLDRMRDVCTPEERCRLILHDEDGPPREPAALWLTEVGQPVRPNSWEVIFTRACKRCEENGFPLSISPHQLRHAFAVHMLALLIQQRLREAALPVGPVESYRLILGDPLQQVQRLLGHASLTTTYIYLDHIATRADTVDAAVEELLALLPGPQGV